MPTVADIATRLNLPIQGGDRNQQINGVASLVDASSSDISFLTSDSYVKQFIATSASAVIVDRRVKLPETPASKAALLIAADSGLATSVVLEMFAPRVPRPTAGIDPAAHVAPDVVLGAGAAIGPKVVIGARTRIGTGTIIHPGVVIGEDVVLGDQCEIFPNVVIRERITIGNRVVIHAGSMIGSDGFGYRWDGSKHAKIPQIGTVLIEDDVEIGSCVCVDRAKMGITRIGRGTKIDNLVQIAHNCITGPHCIIVGQAGMAGSAVLGTGVVLGGQVAVRDHVTMGDGAMAAAKSGIAEDVPPKAIVGGVPAIPHRQMLREQAAVRRLPDLVAQVRKLQEEVELLKKTSSR